MQIIFKQMLVVSLVLFLVLTTVLVVQAENLSQSVNMMAYWNFNEGKISDFSGYGNNAMAVGNFTTSSGPLKEGLVFTGSNYLKVKNSATLNFGLGNFAFSLWFKTNSTKSNSTILDKRGATGAGYHFTLYTGRPCLQLKDENTYANFWPGYNAPVYNDGKWHFLEVSVDRSSSTGIKFYIDGNLVYTANPSVVPGSTTNNVDLLIGKHAYDSYYNFEGELDEVRLYNHACSFNAHWNFNQGNTQDLSANQNHAFNYGALVVPGIVGEALQFTGSNYLQVKNSATLNFGLDNFAFSLWFKTNSTKSNSTILDKRGATGAGYHFTLYTGRPCLQLKDENTYANFWPGYNAPVYNDGKWHFLEVSVDRSSSTGIKFYIDGNLVYTANPSVVPGSTTNNVDLLIGKHAYDSYYNFEGELDEVRLCYKSL